MFTASPANKIRPMQLVQNYAAKVITERRKVDSASDALKQVHWLPIRQRCEFKTLSMTYRALNNETPQYIKELFCLKPTT